MPLNRLKLLGVNQLGEQFLQIRANRPMTKKSITEMDLFLESGKLPVLGASLVEEDKFAAHLNIASPVSQGDLVWLQNFQDTSGFQFGSDTLEIKIPAKFDTLALNIPKVHWSNKKLLRYPNESSEIYINANLPLIFKSDSAFKLLDTQQDSIAIQGSLTRMSSMAWMFQPDSALADGRTFRWQIETRFLHSQLNGRELDSLMAGELSTINADSLGSIRVIQMGVEELICHLKGKGVERQFILDPGTSHILDDLPAQTYFLTAFFDRDGDGRYNSGGLGPASGSESFWNYNSEIKVRARWETDLGIWRLSD